MKKIALGHSDFKTVIEKDTYFIDKKTELLNRGITNIRKLVIVFKGKEVWVNDE